MILPSRIAAAAFAALSLCFAVPASADTIRIDHSSGSTEIDRNPKTVLVYDFGVLETLDQLGIEVTGVPASPIPPFLSKYKDDAFVKIGSLFEPDYEAVNAAEPDLIIVAARSQAKYKELAALAPTIDLTLDEKDTIGSIKKNAEILGRIFGKEDEVGARIAKFDASVAALRTLTAEAGTGLILLTTGGKISAYGKASRFGELHDYFGIRPVDSDVQTAVHGQVVSYEYILERNPDWLFVIDRDAAIGDDAHPAQALLDNALVRQTKAWQKGQLLYLDPAKLYLTSSGLQSQQDIVDTLTAAFRKSLGR